LCVAQRARRRVDSTHKGFLRNAALRAAAQLRRARNAHARRLLRARPAPAGHQVQREKVSARRRRSAWRAVKSMVLMQDAAARTTVDFTAP